MQHFLIKIEEVITSQGNEKQKPSGKQAASYSDNNKRAQNRKTVISVQITMRKQ